MENAKEINYREFVQEIVRDYNLHKEFVDFCYSLKKKNLIHRKSIEYIKKRLNKFLKKYNFYVSDKSYKTFYGMFNFKEDVN